MELLDYLISRGKSNTEAQVKRWKASVSRSPLFRFERDFEVTVSRIQDDRRTYRILVVNSGSGLIYNHVIVLGKRLSERYGGVYSVVGSRRVGCAGRNALGRGARDWVRQGDPGACAAREPEPTGILNRPGQGNSRRNASILPFGLVP